MSGNPRHSWILDCTPRIPDSTEVLDDSLCQWNKDSGFFEWYCGFQKPRITDSKSKISRISDSSRFPYMVRTIRHQNNVLLWTFYGNRKLTAECLSLSRRKLQPYCISGGSILVQSGTIRSKFRC